MATNKGCECLASENMPGANAQIQEITNLLQTLANRAQSPEHPHEVRTRFIEDLREKKYSEEDIELIMRAYSIMLMHECLGQIRKHDGTPYIEHPLEMAREAIRMRLNPTIIVACMLHDVPEDISLTHSQTSGDWIALISHCFDDYHDNAKLVDIIQAETKTESLEALPDKTEVIQHYIETGLGRRALAYLENFRKSVGIDEPNVSQRDKEAIATVLYDLNTLISESFVEKEGQIKFDPSFLVVKILDTWQNLQTPGFWGNQLKKQTKDASTIAKLIRARILTNIAELLGMREVASSMTQNLSVLQNINDLDNPQFIDYAEDSLLRLASRLSWGTVLGQQMQNDVPIPHQFRDSRAYIQMPWAEPGSNTLPEPSLLWYVQLPPDAVPRTIPLSQFFNASGHFFVSSQDDDKLQNLRALVQTAYGRPTVDYFVSRESEPVGKIRIESSAPRYISTLKSEYHAPSQAGEVPERNLFHPNICFYTQNHTIPTQKPLSLTRIDTSLIDLLSFLHSPREFVEDTTGTVDTPYIIFINGKLFLATNESDTDTIFAIAKQQAVENPVVRPIGQPNNIALPVNSGDKTILDRMRQEGKLTLNMVVVSERDD